LLPENKRNKHYGAVNEGTALSICCLAIAFEVTALKLASCDYFTQ